MADEFRTDGDSIVPGDECMACGERAEAHIKFNDVGEIEREPWWCEDYRRSPLSAFRGPSVRFTREEAAGWLRGMALGVTAHYTAPPTGVAGLSIAALRREAREFAKRARLCIKHGQHEAAVEMYLAARILRAVRP